MDEPARADSIERTGPLDECSRAARCGPSWERRRCGRLTSTGMALVPGERSPSNIMNGHPQLIEHIYDAAVEPALWPNVMRELASVLESATASVLLHDLETNSFGYLAVHPDFPPEAIREYEQQFAARDPFRKKAERQGGLKLHTERELAADQSKELAIYNDFYLKWGWGRGLGGYILRNEHEAALLSFQRAADERPYDQREIETAEGLAPHVARAIEVNRRIARATVAREISEESMEGLDAGVVVLDDRRRIVFANRKARQIVGIGDGLVVEKETLVAQRTGDSLQLQRTLDNVLSKGDARGSASCAIHRKSGRPLWLLISRFGPGGRGGALVVINTPDDDLGTLAAQFMKRHNLTAAESRIGAALCRGYAPGEIAQLANISVHTVRSHLKNIQSRLGVHGQTQIVAELLRGPGFVGRT